MLIFGFIITVITLYFAIVILLDKINEPDNFLNYSIALALTISVISYAYYFSLLFQFGYGLLLIFFLIVTGTFVLINSSGRSKGRIAFLKPKNVGAFIIPVIGLLILTSRFNSYVYRWGDWDAWAIWILHAKFLYYPEYWTNMFTNKLAMTHPDYPLMLPSLIAFGWRGVGFITPFVPIAIAHLVFLAIPLTVFIALKKSGHLISAIFSFLIFSMDTKFIHIAGSQYADTLLAFFILLTFVLYKEMKTKGNPETFLLLGFVAGSATWIKNEGLLFFMVFSVVFAFFYYKKPGIILQYLAGSLIPVIVIIHFKLALAPQNDLIHADRGADLLQMIVNPDRYLLIIRHLIETSVSYYWILLVLFAILIIQKVPFVKTTPFVVVALMLSGYFVIYLTTPNDLNWHLGASLDRLLHHIYPACLYLFLLKLNAVKTLHKT